MSNLKIMSFNILSDAPIWKKKWAGKDKEPWIYWNVRKMKILDIITENDPDICLLCECQFDQLLFFQKYCIDNGYLYIYASTEPKKSKETVEKYADYNHIKNPGILIIYKHNVVRLINNHAIDYIDTVNKLGKIDYFIKPCVSNIVLFEKIDDLKRFYFVGLHHYNNPKEEDVKEFEIIILLGKIKHKNLIYDYPVIICGDFNAIPDRPNADGNPSNSNVYKRMESNGYMSIYKMMMGRELKLTVSTEHFKDTLDYIFVNSKCRVKEIKHIDEDNLEKYEIPNEDYPSDHMYLVGIIELYD